MNSEKKGSYEDEVNSKAFAILPSQGKDRKFSIAQCNGNIYDILLENYEITFDKMAKDFSQPVGGIKDGCYFVRTTGTQRNNHDIDNTANILILDGDSQINDHGELVSGAPNPEIVHNCLAKNHITHFICSSHSNGERGEDYYKYRVIILIEYDKKQLSILLDYFHELLHKNKILLVNVKENRTWAQPWYYPRSAEDRIHLFRFYKFLEGSALNAAALCAEYEATHPQINPEPKIKTINTYRVLQIHPIKLFNDYWGSPINYLKTQGYRDKKGRFLAPHCRESSDAGVQICRECIDGAVRVYSHHGNDILNDGLPHDSFDCFKILEHGGCDENALREIGKSFMINDMTLEKHNQIQYKKDNSSKNIIWDVNEVDCD